MNGVQIAFEVVTFEYSTNSFQEASATDPVDSAVLPKRDSPISQLILALSQGTRTIYRLYSLDEALYPFAKQALESHLPQVCDAFVPRGKTAVGESSLIHRRSHRRKNFIAGVFPIGP